MKRFIVLFLIILVFLVFFGCAKDPLDITPDELINVFNDNSEYIFGSRDYLATEVDPIETDYGTIRKFQISDYCGMFMSTNSDGNVNAISMAAETWTFGDEFLPQADIALIADAFLLRGILFMSLHGSKAEKKLSEVLNANPGENGITYEYNGLVYTRQPDENGVQIITITRSK